MKTENQELIDRLDSVIADIEKVKIVIDKKIGVKKLGRSYLYKSQSGFVYNGLLLYRDNPGVISTHPGFICWLDKDWVEL